MMFSRVRLYVSSEAFSDSLALLIAVLVLPQSYTVCDTETPELQSPLLPPLPAPFVTPLRV